MGFSSRRWQVFEPKYDDRESGDRVNLQLNLGNVLYNMD